MIILNIRCLVVWSFFFLLFSVFVYVPEAWRGATVASKIISVSLNGYLGAVNSHWWLVKVAQSFWCGGRTRLGQRLCEV